MARIEYEPRAIFLDFHNRKERYACIVAHRRAGKTVACVADLVLRMLYSVDRRNPHAVYICPIFKQAKKVAWDYLKDFVRDLPDIKINESELKVEFSVNERGTARIQLAGGDIPDSLRGEYYDVVILDEYAQMKPSLISEVVMPATADRAGMITVLGTPKGHNNFYELYNLSKEDDEWFSALLRVDETKIINESELDKQRKVMTEDEYNQEFLCSFEAAIKGAIFANDLKKSTIANVPHEPSLPVETWWDLGVSDSTCIIFTQSVGPSEVRIIDYYENTGEGLPHYINVIKNKPYNYKAHNAPHDIAVREFTSGKSRIETAQKLGIRFDIVPNIPIPDGIHAAQLFLSRCYFDEKKCHDLLEALQNYRYRYNEKLDQALGPLHDWASHASDAFRYLAVGHKDRAKKDSRPARRSVNWMG